MNGTLDTTRLLQGRYEAEGERAASYAFNILNVQGLLYRPVADEEHLAGGRLAPVWPDAKPFAVCLTHDVDEVSRHSARQRLRQVQTTIRAGSRAQALRSLLRGTVSVPRAALHFARDPLHGFERWLELEARAGARSTFFFLPDGSRLAHASDAAYRHADVVRFDGQRCAVAEMMAEIVRRGWEVGLHATWYAYDDAGELAREKGQIERVIGREVVSIRNHVLHYDIRSSPRAQARAGFQFDSTLGFLDNVGFRFGTSYPWALYDLGAEVPLPLVEIPLVAHDGALMTSGKGLRLDEDNAFRHVVQMAEEVEKVHGVLTLLWHADAIASPARWNAYARALEYLRGRNAWITSVREVGEWWKRSGSAVPA